MRNAWIVVALGFLVACGTDKRGADERRASETALEAQQTAFSVGLEKRYGFCQGDCTQLLTVGSNGGAMADVVTTDGQRRSRTFRLTEAELAALRTAITTAMAEPWEARYGCPDCADQGAWALHLVRDGEERRSEIDPQAQPAHLAPLIEQLDALERKHRP